MTRDLEHLGKVTGRIPRNTSSRRAEQFVLEDILIAIGWIDKPHVADALLAKYTGSQEIPPTLLAALEHRWQVHSWTYQLSREQFRELCRLAITEHFDPGVCPSCRGTGERMRSHKGKTKPIVCPQCNGVGQRSFSSRAKAGAIGIHRHTWRNRNLNTLYNQMLHSLRAWETYGKKKMRQYLHENNRNGSS